jgi:glyoxylase-like metal-dependent hydrolase (beta-lactamase superfamily II)
MVESGYHFEIGKFKCTVFSDGTLVSQDTGDEEVFGLNCLFIDSAEHKILIDAGCGEGFQATAGQLVENMESEGIRPSDIDRIIFTHGHIDHVAGAYDSQGKPVFPNARYIVSAREWAYWLTPPGDNELQNMFFGPARKNLLPARDRFILAEDGAEVLPGIELIAARGHTPGVSMVEITSNEKRILFIGDVIHSQREFIEPEYLSMFDVTPAEALATRARVLADVARSGIFIFACHFPFPGLGYIRQINNVFTWQPDPVRPR